MPTISLEEAMQKAKSYGTGDIPITKLPPTQTLHESKSGICDYCNTKRPMIMPTRNKLFMVCWRDICALKESYGDDWDKKINATLEKNKQRRMQDSAFKAEQKKGVTHAGV